jgi:two-component system, chemotaxis family, CheB/CheR fusion protein
MAEKKARTVHRKKVPKPEAARVISKDEFPIVGLGASAGGLEAFRAFFSSMPADSGMAFILVQHLDPTHTSNMVELLRRYTSMPVDEAVDGMAAEPNHVYMIPPNRNMTVSNRTLHLKEQSEHPGIAHSIDLFFRSLATDLKNKSIGVILSGTGADGSIGAKAIKAEMGMVMVQDPDSARYDGMPRAAMAAGVADFVLPAEQIAGKLIDYVQQSYGKRMAKRSDTAFSTTDNMQKMFAIIRARTRRDFSQYKPSTINRRIERRMSVNQIEKMEDYIRLLQENSNEVHLLVQDFLISVTSFFRDPEAFDALKAKLRDLVKQKKEGEEIRAWVLGCATGEEAYSVAILLHEIAEELNTYSDWHVFGTDMDKDAIDFARTGLYPESIKTAITPQRLKKHFQRRDGQLQISKDIREKLIFAVHDIISDPPFSKVDLISTRNLLIYFNSDLQRKVLPVLNYSLKEGGLLFLGTAETIGEFTDMFEMLDRKWRIYENHKNENTAALDLPEHTFHHNLRVPDAITNIKAKGPGDTELAAMQLLIKALPPAVLIDRDFRIIYIHGQVGKYLELPEGSLSSSVIDLARQEVKATLLYAVSEAVKRKVTVIHEENHPKTNGDSGELRITVKPLGNGDKGKLAVIFEDISAPLRSGKKGTKSEVQGKRQELEQELQFSRESLRSAVEELETANEELRSTNEEHQSTNEELQSTNEELETSREELQSVNEELMTVNIEHQKKIEQLTTVNDDMNNLLNSTNIATLFLDENLNIKRYTPAIASFMNLMDADRGRPVSHFASAIKHSDLSESARKVLDTLIPVAEEVQTKDGKWYLMRIHPYRTANNAIAGVVVSFIDIDRQKSLERGIPARE